VKKGVSWALRSIGHRNLVLNTKAKELAEKLAGSADPAERWVGKDVLKDITRPMILKRFK
jgi:3-methyladenine DNA glycosylase AlkD